MNRHLEEEFSDWLKSRRVGEVECLVPDMGGIARGKILPTNKFLSGLRNETLRLPISIFGQMVTDGDAETEVLTYQSPCGGVCATCTALTYVLELAPMYAAGVAQ